MFEPLISLMKTIFYPLLCQYCRMTSSLVDGEIHLNTSADSVVENRCKHTLVNALDHTHYPIRFVKRDCVRDSRKSELGPSIYFNS